MRKISYFLVPLMLLLVFAFILTYSYLILQDIETGINNENVKELLELLKTNVFIAGGITVLTLLIVVWKFLSYISEFTGKFKDDIGFFKSDFIKEKGINLKNLQCIMIIDLDNLLKIENTYGESVVKAILLELFNILNDFFKNFKDKVKFIRYSWDEILILVEKECNNKPLVMASKLKEKIEKHKFKYNSLELNLKANLGLNREIAKMKNLDEAIKGAFIALSQAKKSKKGIAEFGASNKVVVLPKLIEIKEALEKDKISLLFQPIVDVVNKRIFKYEVLTRLLGNDGREINPSEYLEALRGITLATDFNIKVLEKAANVLRKYPQLKISVNFSPVDIIAGAVARKIREINDKDILSRLTIEILETEDIYDYEKFKENIALIKLRGCKIAIDDFGSGYSNFKHLIELNVEFLKIDGEIVKNVKNDNKALILVSAIKDFADRAGIEVICEFVSDEETYKILKKIGIKYMQGYYFGKPINIPKKEIVSLSGEKFVLSLSDKEPKDDWEATIWNEQ